MTVSSVRHKKTVGPAPGSIAGETVPLSAALAEVGRARLASAPRSLPPRCSSRCHRTRTGSAHPARARTRFRCPPPDTRACERYRGCDEWDMARTRNVRVASQRRRPTSAVSKQSPLRVPRSASTAMVGRSSTLAAPEGKELLAPAGLCHRLLGLRSAPLPTEYEHVALGVSDPDSVDRPESHSGTAEVPCASVVTVSSFTSSTSDGRGRRTR